MQDKEQPAVVGRRVGQVDHPRERQLRERWLHGHPRQGPGIASRRGGRRRWRRGRRLLSSLDNDRRRGSGRRWGRLSCRLQSRGGRRDGTRCRGGGRIRGRGGRGLRRGCCALNGGGSFFSGAGRQHQRRNGRCQQRNGRSPGTADLSAPASRAKNGPRHWVRGPPE